MNNDPHAVLNCLACGTQLAPALLTCPQCQRLVHSDELNRLAEAAERATRDGDLGSTAVVVTYVVGWCAGWPSWIAIASVAAWINLFNLLPVWQLDGARGLRALCKHERWWLFGAVAVTWLLTAEGLLLLILIVLGARMFLDTPPEKPDRTALVQFLVLIVALSFMAGLGVLPDATEEARPL